MSKYQPEAPKFAIDTDDGMKDFSTYDAALDFAKAMYAEDEKEVVIYQTVAVVGRNVNKEVPVTKFRAERKPRAPKKVAVPTVAKPAAATTAAVKPATQGK